MLPTWLNKQMDNDMLRTLVVVLGLTIEAFQPRLIKEKLKVVRGEPGETGGWISQIYFTALSI